MSELDFSEKACKFGQIMKAKIRKSGKNEFLVKKRQGHDPFLC